MCRAIGEHGAELIPDGSRVLTHCNAGALATAGIGTALAPLYLAPTRQGAAGVRRRDAPAAAGKPADRVGADARRNSGHGARRWHGGVAHARRRGRSRASSAPTASPRTATWRTRSARTRSRSPRAPRHSVLRRRADVARSIRRPRAARTSRSSSALPTRCRAFGAVTAPAGTATSTIRRST